MKHIIKIDESKCIGCSQCIKDCPQKNIFLMADKKAALKSQDCIKCGHCSAICPVGAVSISGYSEDPIDVSNLEKIDPQKLLNSIISRRSIRQYKDKEIPKEIIDIIIEAGRYTPTGKNAQDVRYIILDKDKKKLELLAVAVFKKLVKVVGVFKKAFKGFEIDDDFFFKKAPIAIVVVAKNDVDGALAASNMALMAEANSLGVLYSGFFSFAAKMSKNLKKELGLRKKEKVVTTLVLGYPSVKYKRSAQKDEANVKYR